jgi:hypothetical protein
MQSFYRLSLLFVLLIREILILNLFGYIIPLLTEDFIDIKYTVDQIAFGIDYDFPSLILCSKGMNPFYSP